MEIRLDSLKKILFELDGTQGFIQGRGRLNSPTNQDVRGSYRATTSQTARQTGGSARHCLETLCHGLRGLFFLQVTLPRDHRLYLELLDGAKGIWRRQKVHPFSHGNCEDPLKTKINSRSLQSAQSGCMFVGAFWHITPNLDLVDPFLPNAFERNRTPKLGASSQECGAAPSALRFGEQLQPNGG